MVLTFKQFIIGNQMSSKQESVRFKLVILWEMMQKRQNRPRPTRFVIGTSTGACPLCVTSPPFILCDVLHACTPETSGGHFPLGFCAAILHVAIADRSHVYKPLVEYP